MIVDPITYTHYTNMAALDKIRYLRQKEECNQQQQVVRPQELVRSVVTCPVDDRCAVQQDTTMLKTMGTPLDIDNLKILFLFDGSWFQPMVGAYRFDGNGSNS